MHAASPYIANVSADQGFERLVKPAVQGTENVLGKGLLMISQGL